MRNTSIKVISSTLLAASIISFSASSCSLSSGNPSHSDQLSTVELNEDTSLSGTEASDDPEKQQTENSQVSDDEPDSVPDLPDPAPDDDGQTVNGIFIHNRTAYELFYGYDELAQDYAKTMSAIKEHLGNDIKVYNVIVPTHCGVTLPERFSDMVASQKDYLNAITSSYTADIIPVNTYDTMMRHRNEYLYFNTDHHWTGLAAYYAYKEFCKTAGVDYLKLSDMKKGEIPGYYGSLTNYVDESLVDPDTVEYYTADKDIDTYSFDANGGSKTEFQLMHTYAEGSNAYGVFLGGDAPLMVSENKNGNGKKIAVVKESYGNAFCPYIAYTYSETYMIDFRYIEFDFKEFLNENGIDEVIFINNAMASATPQRCEELQALAN